MDPRLPSTHPLVERLAELARKEVELGLAEAHGELRRALVPLAATGLATVCALVALVSLLGRFVPAWAAALGLAALFLLVAAIAQRRAAPTGEATDAPAPRFGPAATRIWGDRFAP